MMKKSKRRSVCLDSHRKTSKATKPGFDSASGWVAEERSTRCSPVVSLLLLVCANLPLYGQHAGHEPQSGSGHMNQHDERALREDPRLAPGQIAPVLEGLGEHHHKVTTSSDRAQLFFDQGLKLTYAFNHQEALRAFKESARLDPDSAMAHWGWALVLGPNLNLPMQDGVVSQAYEAVQMAMQKRSGVTERERDYIEALAARYAPEPVDDRSALDEAYSEAMRKVHEKYPDDTDAATLYAASLMNLSPWNYWSKDGHPGPRTLEILSTLEDAIRKDHHHEGALHYYIHAVEAVDPDRGVAAADALRGLAPGAGHLVHMPTHIYIQVGRYRESFDLNQLASQADENYIVQCRAQGIYPLNYYPHNVHFGVWAAMLLGKSEAALEGARKIAANVPADSAHNYWAAYDTFLSMPLYVMVRFGMWEQLLAEPEPSESKPFLSGISHYARGLAFHFTGQTDQAAHELEHLNEIIADPSTPETLIGLTNAESLLQIAREILAAEIDLRSGQHQAAISRLEKAVRLQDGLIYTEPPDWYYSVRHSLGAALLEAGLPKEAEVVYWQDLRQFRNNGFALFGLATSLESQGRYDEAAQVRKRFQESWSFADVQLTSSRY